MRSDLSIVILDSTVRVGGAEAVSMSARAELVPDAELERCAELYSTRLPEQSRCTADELRTPSPLRLYRARVSEHSILVRGGDPDFGRGLDSRMSVDLFAR